MKLNIIKQSDSIYSNHGISIETSMYNWESWTNEVRKRHDEAIKTGFKPNTIFDTDECAECGVISEEHATAFIQYVLETIPK